MLTLRHRRQVKTCFEEIHKISVAMVDLMIYKNFANYYGQCPICWDDMWNTDTVFTKCHHIFHETCINKWLNDDDKSCPICRSILNKKDSFLNWIKKVLVNKMHFLWCLLIILWLILIITIFGNSLYVFNRLFNLIQMKSN